VKEDDKWAKFRKLDELRWDKFSETVSNQFKSNADILQSIETETEKLSQEASSVREEPHQVSLLILCLTE
jgi:hypothetical protein